MSTSLFKSLISVFSVKSILEYLAVQIQGPDDILEDIEVLLERLDGRLIQWTEHGEGERVEIVVDGDIQLVSDETERQVPRMVSFDFEKPLHDLGCEHIEGCMGIGRVNIENVIEFTAFKLDFFSVVLSLGLTFFHDEHATGERLVEFEIEHATGEKRPANPAHPSACRDRFIRRQGHITRNERDSVYGSAQKILSPDIIRLIQTFALIDLIRTQTHARIVLPILDTFFQDILEHLVLEFTLYRRVGRVTEKQRDRPCNEQGEHKKEKSDVEDKKHGRDDQKGSTQYDHGLRAAFPVLECFEFFVHIA